MGCEVASPYPLSCLHEPCQWAEHLSREEIGRINGQYEEAHKKYERETLKEFQGNVHDLSFSICKAESD